MLSPSLGTGLADLQDAEVLGGLQRDDGCALRSDLEDFTLLAGPGA